MTDSSGIIFSRVGKEDAGVVRCRCVLFAVFRLATL